MSLSEAAIVNSGHEKSETETAQQSPEVVVSLPRTQMGRGGRLSVLACEQVLEVSVQSFSSLLFNIILEALVDAVRRVKGMKGLQTEEEGAQLFQFADDPEESA